MKGGPVRAKAGHSEYHSLLGETTVVESAGDWGKVIFIF